MGTAVSVLTAVAAYTSSYSIYYPNNTIATITPAYVLGGSFAFTYTNIDDAAFDNITFYNTTSSSIQVPIGNCTISGDTCTTAYTNTLTGTPYSYETFLGSDTKPGTTQANGSLSIFVIPPVPSQTTVQFLPSYNPLTTSLYLAASNFSVEYGSAMTGCLLHYGPTPYTIPPTLPQLLDPLHTANNQLPALSVAYYNQSQGTSTLVVLSQLGNVVSGTAYDYHFVCYNGNGPSPDTAYYNVNLVYTLPPPVSSSSSSSAAAPSSSFITSAATFSSSSSSYANSAACTCPS